MEKFTIWSEKAIENRIDTLLNELTRNPEMEKILERIIIEQHKIKAEYNVPASAINALEDVKTEEDAIVHKNIYRLGWHDAIGALSTLADLQAGA